MTDFAYDGPIFLVPLSPSYPSSPVVVANMMISPERSLSPSTKVVVTMLLWSMTKLCVLSIHAVIEEFDKVLNVEFSSKGSLFPS